MAAATITELSVTDLPMDIRSGTIKRRQLVAIRYTSTGATDTIPLGSYIPEISDIEGIVWDSMNSANRGTATTWSAGTATTAANAGSGVGELGLIINF